MESFGSDTFIDGLRTEFGILVASQDPDMLQGWIRASQYPNMLEDCVRAYGDDAYGICFYCLD